MVTAQHTTLLATSMIHNLVWLYHASCCKIVCCVTTTIKMTHYCHGKFSCLYKYFYLAANVCDFSSASLPGKPQILYRATCFKVHNKAWPTPFHIQLCPSRNRLHCNLSPTLYPHILMHRLKFGNLSMISSFCGNMLKKVKIMALERANPNMARGLELEDGETEFLSVHWYKPTGPVSPLT